MSIVKDILFKLHRKCTSCPSPREANQQMYQLLSTDKPLMIARFGAVEIKMMLYAMLPWPLNLLLKWKVYENAHICAGFFPVDDNHLRRFAKRMLQDIKELDILASWRPEELLLRSRLKHVRLVTLRSIQPIDRPQTYLTALKGKRVLVVSPFAETILSQYTKHRTQLFHDEIIPEFASLEAVKAIQTAGGGESDFTSWFDALKYMEDEIDRHDYDVALLGCGAYGFPLAAHCKRRGKQAIHIGGTLQLFFGIAGRRWCPNGLPNPYWVWPSKEDRPKDYLKVEGGCYW